MAVSVGDVARRTVQRDLERLAELGWVAEIGRGATEPNRASLWVVAVQ
jgi:DeoR/GlpR family transcriptional regulator of sugar metabolism